MLEVFTVGGGEYIVNVFNAVAAWTGDGGYKALIRVAMVMALSFALISVAFNANWKAWLHWFLQATLIYTCLMVPRTSVQVTDRLNPDLAPATVANVPIGLAALASFTSQVADYLTTSAELVFGLPTDLNYSANGMIYASRLFEATQSLTINDPEFASNIDEHIRQCVFYDVLLGRKSMDTLAKADDLWAAMGPGSVARSQRFLTRSGTTVTSSIIPCRNAYDALSAQWAAMINAQTDIFGRQLYPKQTAALAKAKLVANLPIAYQYLTGVSRSANEILRQQMLVNAMGQAMHTMAGTGGGGVIDVYAQTRAEVQTRNTYNAIAYNAMKWVPVLHIVLTVLFYALFPVLFPLFLFPRGGPEALKGYVTGFFYLAAWGPLFVILHMIMNYRAASEVAAAGFYSNGLSLASAAGISAVNTDVATLSGYLVASIPFLAAGVARGAMAIAGHATSYLNPSQNAAEESAREATTGNIALGNTSLDNFSFNTRQGNAWSTAPNLMSGSGSVAQRLADGSVSYQFPGSEVLDTRGAISSLPFTPQLSRELSSAFNTSAAETRAQGQTLSNQASETFTLANGRATELAQRLSSGTTLENSFGSSAQATIGRTLSELEQASGSVQERFGLDKSAADSLVLERFQSGTWSARASADLAGRLGLGKGGGGGSGGGAGATGASVGGSLGGGYDGQRGSSDRSSSNTTEAATNALSSAQDFVEQLARTNNWSSQRESFNRAVQTSSNSDIRSLGQTVTTSYNEAQSLERQSRDYHEQSGRYEEQASLAERAGVSVGENLSQRFMDFVANEQTKQHWQRFAWKPMTHGDASTPEQIAERDYWIDRFLVKYEDDLKNGIVPSLEDVGPAQIVRPGVSTQAGLRKAAAATAADLGGDYGDGLLVQSPEAPITNQVISKQQSGERQLELVEAYREGQAEKVLKADSEETLGRRTPLEKQNNDSWRIDEPLRQPDRD